MEEKNKIYTAADFARYHAGTMPPGEMHELEKAALEDPFLEDALEGYTHSLDVEDDIKELKTRLAEKRKKQRVFFISSLAQNRWLRIAALFIIVAGAGFFFYQLNFTKKENSLAEIKMKSSPEKTDSVIVLKAETDTSRTDSITSSNDIAFENRPASESPRRQKITLPQAKSEMYKEAAAPAKKVETQIAQQNYTSPLKDSPNNFAVLDKELNKDSNSLTTNEYVLKGVVIDDLGAPVPFANITDKASNKGTIADGNGRFFLKSKDSSITAMATAAGFEAKIFPLKKDMAPKIAMNRSAGDLSEAVVITALGQKHKQLNRSSSVSKALNGKAAGAQATANELRPSGGLEKFDQYVKASTTPVYDEDNERLTGEVLLSFTINKKGWPKNIKVVKSSCEPCEEEAIRLLENGPAWIGKINTIGTVVIKF